jgi:tRNA(fMet)-specific endonuclease VapC
VGPLHLDTNAYVAFKLGREDAHFILCHAPIVVLSAIVLGELKAGFQLGARAQENERELGEFLASPRVRIVSIGAEAAACYAAIYRQLRRAGRAIPTNDLWIAAAVAADRDAILYSYDAHFHNIKGLRVIAGADEFLSVVE